VAEIVPVLSLDALKALMAEHRPHTDGYRVLRVWPGGLLFEAEPSVLPPRPGGTVSCTALFAFADVAAYFAVNACLGPTTLAMVTATNISFLEAPRPGVLRATAEPLRIGRRTAVVGIRIEDLRGELVAVATLHFSFPAGGRVRPAELA
jgi:uncharacterized protein (TIGR00369 family)